MSKELLTSAVILGLCFTSMNTPMLVFMVVFVILSVKLKFTSVEPNWFTVFIDEWLRFFGWVITLMILFVIIAGMHV